MTTGNDNALHSSSNPTNSEDSDDIILTRPQAKPAPAPLELPEISQDSYAYLTREAKAYVDSLLTIDVHSAAFVTKIKMIDNLGNADMVRIGGGSRRLLERSSNGSNNNYDTGNAQQNVSGALDELKQIVDELTPTEKNLNPRGFLGIFPKSQPLNNYFAKYNNAQDSLNTVIKALMRGKDDLLKDNAALEQEKEDLRVVLANLNEYSLLADIIETEVLNKISELKVSGQTAIVSALEADILFSVRQKKQDIVTRLAVGMQAYLAMELIRRNNTELSKGVDRARITTVTALRTAILVAQSLTNQRLLIEQIDSVMRSTEATVKKASASLSREAKSVSQGKSDKEQAITELKAAFSQISDALDAVTEVREQADEQMSETVSNLSSEAASGQERIADLVYDQLSDQDKGKGVNNV